MKKIIKIISLIAAISLLSTFFTGCEKLDKYKSGQAFWNNKNKTEILYDNSIYVKLPYNECFVPSIMTSQKYNTISKKDVPVLIAAAQLKYGFTISKDKKIIGVGGNYFSRKDCFEEFKSLMSNYTLDVYGVEICFPVKDGSVNELLLMTDEENKVLDTVKNNLTETPNVEEDYIEYNLSVNLADKSGMLRSPLFELYYYKNADTVMVFNDGKMYNIPKDQQNSVLEIMKKYCELQKQ